jgi:hypothetical protein
MPMLSLPKPEVVRCFHATGFEPHLPAMVLRWADSPSHTEHIWHLPDNLTLKGPAPQRFGITVHRLGPNAFQVRCLWDNLSVTWERLTRSQVMASSLSQILSALGTDLWYLLNQPVEPTAAQAA